MLIRSGINTSDYSNTLHVLEHVAIPQVNTRVVFSHHTRILDFELTELIYTEITRIYTRCKLLMYKRRTFVKFNGRKT